VTIEGSATRASIPALIREVIDETRDWLKAEIALLRAQVSDTLARYAAAVFAWMLAAVLTLTALIYLTHAAMLLLSSFIGETGAALAVGSTLLGAAVVACLYGRAKFLHAGIVPVRIAQALGEDAPGKKRAAP
jgi:hypothetical protein